MLAPTEDLLNDLMSAYNKTKLGIFVCHIQYSPSSLVSPATNTTSTPLVHLLSLMMNPRLVSVRVRVAALPQTSLTLRSALLPGIEKAFTDERSAAYMARRSYKDFGEFLDYFKQTKVDDYTKNK